MNKGLLLITPVALVRLLSIEDFGRYREFLVYAGLLTAVAAFNINSSLLRFVPERPGSRWRFVNQAALMTCASSLIIAGGVLALNALFAGKLVGEYALPLALYVLFFVNMDFWEFLWLAERRSLAVVRYSTGRLAARVIVVIASAALTRDVGVIIWSLVCFEALRLAISLIAWRVGVRARAPEAQGHEASTWREQWSYCLPFGCAMVLVNINKQMGSLFVAKMLGPVALAHFAIGLYVQPVLSIVRNSLSDVLLPEIVSRNAGSTSDRLKLWRRTTVMTAILLFGAGVLLARFADVIVVTLFSESYRSAVAVFQIYLLVFLREAMDFGVPLRAINRNLPIFYGNLIAIAVNAAVMLVLLPIWGIAGAAVALVLSRYVEGAYLAAQMARAYDTPMRALAPWIDLLKIAGAAALSAVVLYGEFWTERLGLLGVVLGGAVYVATFGFVLTRLKIPEATLLTGKLRAAPALVLRRPQ